MGRSRASCFKSMVCCSDPLDGENNDSKNRRGWGFGKRSARHRVLSNTVISETPENKESPESDTINLHTQTNASVSEKTCAVSSTDDDTYQKVQYIDDKPQLSAPADPEVSKTVVSTEDDSKADGEVDESVIIFVQSSIRVFLAQITLLKHKNAVKLQAVMRGHLVRRQAAATLRCVHAVVKFQGLLRARRARLLLKESCTEEKERENSGTGPKPTASSNVKVLLSNGFARQLLESKPRPKPIYIKCDPLSSDSSWKWLERWMAVSATAKEPSQKPEQVENSVPRLVTGVSFGSYCESRSFKANTKEAGKSLITPEEDDFNFQVIKPTLSNTGTTDLEENSISLLPSKSKQSDTEGKKSVFGLRKASNPTFIAAQSKFKVLSSSPSPARTSIVSSRKGGGDEPNTEASILPSTQDSPDRSGGDEPNTETLIFEVGRTEPFISPTRDSPDRSDFESPEVVVHLEKVSDKSEFESPEVVVHLEKVSDRSEVEAGEVIVHLEKVSEERTNEFNCDDFLDIEAKVKADFEANPSSEDKVSNVQIDVDSAPDHQTSKSSRVLESHGSPSSQLSEKGGKRTTGDKSGTKPRRVSLSSEKRTPPPSNPDHVRRNSSEELSQDQKTGKRRISFDKYEPRRSTGSSGSLPNYMQATESARAKAHANSSPKSSPDVDEKDADIKIRHSPKSSLTERRESSHARRSIFPTKQGEKGNGSVAHEREWRR